MNMRIGVISDTHGLLRDEVLARLAGADLVLHAGDVGEPEILDRLREVAPTLAVRGNVDKPDRFDLPGTLLHEVGGVWIYMLHDLGALDLSPAAAGIRVVISGHSHVPRCFEKDGVLYFNPGSCGKKRFSLPISMGWLFVQPSGNVRAEHFAILPT